MKYKELKEISRDAAIELQEIISNGKMSYGELLYYKNLLHKLGKRSGLVKEFKENGLI